MDFPVAAAVAILGTILLGAISPGPSFVVVARTAAAASRRDGLATALGMGVGGLVFASAALLGLDGRAGKRALALSRSQSDRGLLPALLGYPSLDGC